jgi:hypothetical protein
MDSVNRNGKKRLELAETQFGAVRSHRRGADASLWCGIIGSFLAWPLRHWLQVAGADGAVRWFTAGSFISRATNYLDPATRQIARPKATIATVSSAPAQAAWNISSRPPGW